MIALSARTTALFPKNARVAKVPEIEFVIDGLA